MRKAIFVIIQIIVIIIFLRSSYAQYFFGDIGASVASWYESIADVPERSKITYLRDEFMRNNMALKPHQVDYVIEVTDSAEAINSFYATYCVKGDKNPYIYGANLAKLCEDIRGSELLFQQ